jgi:hypothetical protein
MHLRIAIVRSCWLLQAGDRELVHACEPGDATRREFVRAFAVRLDEERRFPFCQAF